MYLADEALVLLLELADNKVILPVVAVKQLLQLINLPPALV